MRIPNNQHLGHTWLILAPYAYHDNWSVGYLIKNNCPYLECLECSDQTKKLM